ncbi:hypothetical protein [Rhodococcus qingshengii]|uniref:hypothetical protein n=1 Tax=Rhodococcus qingshengii TaxID=334542 RepID=UPI0035DA1B99
MSEDVADEVIRSVLDAHNLRRQEMQVSTCAEFAYGTIVPQKGRLEEVAALSLAQQANVLHGVILADHLEKGFDDIDRVYPHDTWMDEVRRQLGIHVAPVISLGTVMLVVSDTHVVSDSSFMSFVKPSDPGSDLVGNFKTGCEILLNHGFMNRNHPVNPKWYMWSYVSQ